MSRSESLPNFKNALQKFGTIATVLGSFSVVIVFIALYTAWIFGKGMLAALGFPASLIGFKGSLDTYPMLSIQYGSFFLLFLVGGFLPAKKRYKVIAVVLILILCILNLAAFFVEDSAIFLLALWTAATFGPLSVGYTIQSFETLRFKLIGGFLISIFIFIAYSEFLYRFGVKKGQDISTTHRSSLAESGTTIFKLNEYPYINIFSTDRLLLRTPPTQVENGFLYSPQGEDFIRLIFTDDDKYYFVESTPQGSMSVAVSKSSVTQIQFVSSK